MPFCKERAKRLTELLGLIQKSEAENSCELTYRAVVYLEEIRRLVMAQISSDDPYDSVTLLDCAVIMRYLADAYDRLGRFALSAGYYQKAIDLAAALYEVDGTKIQDAKEMVYRGLKARNYYIDDDCPDLRRKAYVFLSAREVDETFETFFKCRRLLKHDPVEMTEAYLAVIDEVEAQIEERRTLYGPGSCHQIWSLKSELLAEKGVIWHSPAVLNPRVRFD